MKQLFSSREFINVDFVLVCMYVWMYFTDGEEEMRRRERVLTVEIIKVELVQM